MNGRVNGTTMSEATEKLPFEIYDVWGDSINNIVAVGTEGNTIHFNGTEWVELNSITDMSIYGLWGHSGTCVFGVGGEVVAVDDTRNGIVVHYDGKEWSELYSVPYQLLDVWGVSDRSIVAVGSGKDSGLILHLECL